MVKEIFNYVRCWLKGEPAELTIAGEIEVGWWEVGAILIIIGLIIYWICR
jgi:hypothetical protein